MPSTWEMKPRKAFPRIYADADVVITVETIRSLALLPGAGNVLRRRPHAEFRSCRLLLAGSRVLRVRALLPSAQEGIGGSGVYALSAAGRARFHEFPTVTADDGYVRIQFQPEERETLRSASSTVFPPRNIKDLIATKTRAHYGSLELGKSVSQSSGKTAARATISSLIRLFKDPRLWGKLAILLSGYSHRETPGQKRLRGAITGWERDNTSRATA